MSAGYVDVPLDGLDPALMVPTLPGLGLTMQTHVLAPAAGEPESRPTADEHDEATGPRLF